LNKVTLAANLLSNPKVRRDAVELLKDSSIHRMILEQARQRLLRR
jgi:hypothetical protein